MYENKEKEIDDIVQKPGEIAHGYIDTTSGESYIYSKTLKTNVSQTDIKEAKKFEIENKNKALLYSKHKNPVIRELCKRILRKK